jgi:hypothetical protein
MLILSAIVPDSILAMERPESSSYHIARSTSSSSSSSSSSVIFPESLATNRNAIACPNKIEKITLPSTPIDTSYIPTYSRRSALSAAVGGTFLAGVCARKYGQQLSLIQQAGITLGVATVSSALAYLGTQKILTNRAAAQATINQANLVEDQEVMDSRIDLYNNAYNTYQIAAFDRILLQPLLKAMSTDDPSVIYEHASNSPNINRDLKNAAFSINAEEEALEKVKTDIPQFKNRYTQATLDLIEKIMNQIKDNCKIIRQANSTLSKETINAWIKVESLYSDDDIPEEYYSAGEAANDQWEGEEIDWGYESK